MHEVDQERGDLRQRCVDGGRDIVNGGVDLSVVKNVPNDRGRGGRRAEGGSDVQ